MPFGPRPLSPRRARLLTFMLPLITIGFLLSMMLGNLTRPAQLEIATGPGWSLNDLLAQANAGKVVEVIPAVHPQPASPVASPAASAAAAGGSPAAAAQGNQAQSGQPDAAAAAGVSPLPVQYPSTEMSGGGQPAPTASSPAAQVIAAVSSSPRGPSTDVVAAARTTDGRIVPIEVGAQPSVVIGALRLLGKSSLISAAADSRWPASGGSPLSSSNLFPVVVVALFAIAAVFVIGLRLGRGRRPAEDPLGAGRVATVNPGASPGSEAAPPANPVTFADVAGVDEAKLELAETVEFLKEPERFRALGAKPVRGVLLSGPPGTGKTLLAKAVANEAGVPFFAASGSEFVERYVGVGAERVRALFAKARAASRGVIFIDEIDAVAKSRGGPNSHDEREQTLNQLLVELDGFSTTDSVVVIAATNRVDTLDQALLRPGRFTRKVHVPLPDREGREAILQVHAADKPLTDDVDLPALARRTYGFSGAMLADLLNEAAIYAARAHRQEVTAEDVHRGWLKVAIGSSRQRSMDERERSIIAAHEAGHAICSGIAGDGRRVEEISLFQHGEALGVTVSSAQDDALPSEARLRARLIALMGGRAAEELVFGEVTGGASNDFEQATQLATMMVTRWGLGIDPEAVDPGPTGRGVLSAFVATSEGIPIPSELVAAQGRAMRKLLDDAYEAARELLRGQYADLDAVAAYLFERERMSGDELEGVLAGTLRADTTDRWRSLAGEAPIAPRLRPVPAAVPARQPLPYGRREVEVAAFSAPSSAANADRRTRNPRRDPDAAPATGRRPRRGVRASVASLALGALRRARRPARAPGRPASRPLPAPAPAEDAAWSEDAG